MSSVLSLPPLHTQDTITKRCMRQVRTEGGCDMAAPIFPTLGGRISMAKVSYDLNFWIFGTFCGISKKGIIVEGKS
jgi:hypothetical protein